MNCVRYFEILRTRTTYLIIYNYVALHVCVQDESYRADGNNTQAASPLLNVLVHCFWSIEMFRTPCLGSSTSIPKLEVGLAARRPWSFRIVS